MQVKTFWVVSIVFVAVYLQFICTLKGNSFRPRQEQVLPQFMFIRYYLLIMEVWPWREKA